MDFVKKHYEKVLLGLVLLALTVAVGLLPLKIASERQDLDDMRSKLLHRPVKELPPVDLSRDEATLQRVQLPVKLRHEPRRGVIVDEPERGQRAARPGFDGHAGETQRGAVVAGRGLARA